MRLAAALSGGLLRQGLGSIRLGESQVGLFGAAPAGATRQRCGRVPAEQTFVDEDGTMALLILTCIMSGASICRYANRHLCPARTPGTTPGDGCAPRTLAFQRAFRKPSERCSREPSRSSCSGRRPIEPRGKEIASALSQAKPEQPSTASWHAGRRSRR